MWLEKETKKVYFECKVVETDTVVINGAFAELHSVKSETPEPVVAQPTAASTGDFASEKIFTELSNKLSTDASIAKSINAVYEFSISKGDSTINYSKLNTILNLIPFN